MTPTVFTERQLFIRYWWWILLMPLLTGGAIATAILAKHHTHVRPFGWWGWLVLGGALLLFVGVLFLRLDVRLDATGVHYRMAPLQLKWRHRPWSAVTRAHVRSYDPLGEYGGWGLKGRPGNWAMNVAGDEGIQLELTDGTRLLLGTQRPTEARQALEQLGRHSPPAA